MNIRNELEQYIRNLAEEFYVFVNVIDGNQEDSDYELYFNRALNNLDHAIEGFEECLGECPDLSNDLEELIFLRDCWENNEIEIFSDNIGILEDIIETYTDEEINDCPETEFDNRITDLIDRYDYDAESETYYD